MAKYLYSAIFTPDEGAYDITFPDLPDCYTCGDNLQDAMKMATDALNSYLAWQEDHGKEIPKATDQTELKTPSGSIVTLIAADTEAYRRLLSKRAVKKTLTIPEWMDKQAKARGINFSKALQDALMEQLQHA